MIPFVNQSTLLFITTTMPASKILGDAAVRAATVHVRGSKVPSAIQQQTAALFSAYGGAKPTLPDLAYDYGALERTYKQHHLDNSSLLWGRMNIEPCIA